MKKKIILILIIISTSITLTVNILTTKQNKTKIIDLSSVDDLIEKIKEKEPSDRIWKDLQREIDQLETNPKLLPFLLEAIQKSQNNTFKELTISWLGTQGEKATASIPILLKNLDITNYFKRKNVMIVFNSIIALGQIGKNSKETISSLTNILKKIDEKDPSILNDYDYMLFQNISLALRYIGPNAKESIPFLLALIKKIEWRYSVYAINTLGEIANDKEEEVISELSKLLKSNENAFQFTSAQTLSKLSTNICEGIPILVKNLKGKNKAFHYPAALALSRYQLETLRKYHIETRLVVTVLIKESQNINNHYTNRIESIKGLINLGKEAKESIPILLKMINDKNENNQIKEIASKAIKVIKSD